MSCCDHKLYETLKVQINDKIMKKYKATIGYTLNERTSPEKGYLVHIEYDDKNLTDEEIINKAKFKIDLHPKINNLGIKSIGINVRDNVQ